MYTSDLTEAQKAFIKETIPMDNHDFPAWQTVYYYFRAWSAIGEFKNLLDSLVSQV